MKSYPLNHRPSGMRRVSHLTSFGLVLAIIFLTAIQSGCAIHYYDRETETEHLWGFGHLQMKASTPDEGCRAVVEGLETVGLSLGAGRDGFHLDLGWNRQRVLKVVDENASVRLEWPDSDFFKVRVGSIPPFLKGQEQKRLETED